MTEIAVASKYKHVSHLMKCVFLDDTTEIEKFPEEIPGIFVL